MDETNSSSRVILSKTFEKLIEWRSRRITQKRDLYKFKWCPFHLSVVHGYVLIREYLMELIDKSLVTVVERRSDGGVKTCVVHDLLHEFCLQRCQEEILHTVVDKHYSMNEKQQRLRIDYFVKSPKLPVFGLHIRSILGCFPTSGFLNMKLLKVLDLMGVICLESLKEIIALINLKHLGIGYGLPSQPPQPLELSFISCLLKLDFLIVKSQFYLVCNTSQTACSLFILSPLDW